MQKLKKQKVRMHSMSVAAWQKILGIQKYEGRAILSAREGDIVVTSEPFNPEYLAYVQEFLGMGKDIMFLTAKGQGANLTQRILADPDLKSQLSQIKDSFVLDPFIAGPDEDLLAQELQMPILGKSSIAMECGSKSGFRRLARKADCSIASGYENVSGADEVIIATEKLFKNCQEVVIKENNCASSAQLFRVKKVSGWRQRVQSQCAKINYEIGVVEQWIPFVIGSPSIHFYVNGGIKPLLGPWRQFLLGANKQYNGTTFPAGLSAEDQEKIWREGEKIALEYELFGYQGEVGFDFVVCKNGSANQVYAVEANARKGGVHYVRKFAQLQGIGSDKVVWGRDFKSEKLKSFVGSNFGNLVKMCRPDLYTQDKKVGLVFYNEGLLEKGKIQIIVVADDHEKAADYLSRLKDRLE